MQTVTILVLGVLVLVSATSWFSERTGRSWFTHLNGWQKLFGVLAVILTLLIMLNPELLALGLIGDTALFDMFVLALSLQMHRVVVRAFDSCMGALSRSVRWLGIPSPGMLYLSFLLVTAMTSALAGFQKTPQS